MTLKKCLLYSTLFFVPSAWSCTLESYPELYIVNTKDPQTKSMIKTTDCDNLVQESFQKIIFATTGTVRAEILSQLMHRPEVRIVPETIEVHSLEKELLAKLPGAQGLSLEQYAPLEKLSLLAVSDGESLEWECHNCDQPGTKSPGLVHFGRDRSILKRYWFSVKLALKVKAFVAHKDILPFTVLSPDDFSETIVTSQSQGSFIQDLKDIQYFSSTKFIKKDSPLRTADVTKISLVKGGSLVKVICEKGSLSLTTMGLAKGNGTLGQAIEVQNMQSKKIFTGQVSGLNTVSVDL